MCQACYHLGSPVTLSWGLEDCVAVNQFSGSSPAYFHKEFLCTPLNLFAVQYQLHVHKSAYTQHSDVPLGRGRSDFLKLVLQTREDDYFFTDFCQQWPPIIVP